MAKKYLNWTYFNDEELALCHDLAKQDFTTIVLRLMAPGAMVDRILSKTPEVDRDRLKIEIGAYLDMLIPHIPGNATVTVPLRYIWNCTNKKFSLANPMTFDRPATAGPKGNNLAALANRFAMRYGFDREQVTERLAAIVSTDPTLSEPKMYYALVEAFGVVHVPNKAKVVA